MLLVMYSLPNIIIIIILKCGWIHIRAICDCAVDGDPKYLSHDESASGASSLGEESCFEEHHRHNIATIVREI